MRRLRLREAEVIPREASNPEALTLEPIPSIAPQPDLGMFVRFSKPHVFSCNIRGFVRIPHAVLLENSEGLHKSGEKFGLSSLNGWYLCEHEQVT